MRARIWGQVDLASWHRIPALPLVACVVVRQGGQVGCYGGVGRERSPPPLEAEAPGKLRTSICCDSMSLAA